MWQSKNTQLYRTNTDSDGIFFRQHCLCVWCCKWHKLRAYRCGRIGEIGREQSIYQPQHTLHENLQVDFKYGELVGCFKSECELPDYRELSFCIIRRLDLMELSGESTTNVLECPLLTSTTTLEVLPTSFIHVLLQLYTNVDHHVLLLPLCQENVNI